MLTESDEKLLFRTGTNSLRKAAKRWDYFNAVWTRKGKLDINVYRIVARSGGLVYLRYADPILDMPQDKSHRTTVGAFLKEFELCL